MPGSSRTTPGVRVKQVNKKRFLIISVPRLNIGIDVADDRFRLWVFRYYITLRRTLGDRISE